MLADWQLVDTSLGKRNLINIRNTLMTHHHQSMIYPDLQHASLTRKENKIN